MWLVPMAALCISMTGCIDDNYDLSDIDTNVLVRVDKLVVPLNIDEITLESVLDLDDESKIKNVNGVYAFVDEGEFKSEGVRVEAVNVASPAIKPTVATIHIPSGLPSGSLPAGEEITFDVGGESTGFAASTTNVPSAIVELDKAGCSFALDIIISLKGLDGKVGNVRMRDMVMQLPRGLVIAEDNGNYDASTGRYVIGDRVAAGTSLKMHFTVTGIDFGKAGVNYDYAAHKMSFEDRLSLLSAVLVVTSSDIKVPLSQLPASFTLETSFRMSDIHIDSFTGKVKYDIDGFNISDVTLNDLPDILTQEGTDLRIANPQIYLNVTNPLNEYSLKAETGLAITSYKENSKVGTYALDAPGIFVVDGIPGQKEYNYYLSPSTVSTLYPGYGNALHVGYSSLSDVLSGNGLPTRLAIDFIDPRIPVQNVNNFRLGVNLGDVAGHYTFYAPLAFKAGSTVVYHDVADGWSSEDLDAMTVETLEVTMNVSTNIPVSVDFTGYPVDVNGRQLGNVTIEGAKIEANAQDQPVTIRITGSITGLDGISFTARATATSDENALSPDMYLTLKNLRPCVSGYYEKEL